MPFRRQLENPSLNEAFDSIRSDYAASRQSRYRRRRTGVLAMGSHADWHYRVEADYLRLMEYARDFDRNDMVIGQMVSRAVENTLQEGIHPDPQTGDDGLDDELKSRWTNWADDPEQCDLEGEKTFNEQAWLAQRHLFVDGDITAIATRDGALQWMEGHRLRTPRNTAKNVVHGILLDDRRRRLEYWFTKEDISPNVALNKVGETAPVPVRDADGYKQVFQVYHPKRMTQTRGVTVFAPVFDPVGMFEDINFAKLVQQQVVSCFGIIRTLDAMAPDDDPQPTGEVIPSINGDGSSLTVQGIAPGMQIRGKPGEKIEAFSANVPNAEYFQHATLIVRIIGINLGLPLSLAMMDTSNTVFHGYRGEIEMAKMGFRSNQRALIRRLHLPVYRWKVRQWGADDPAIAAAFKRTDVDVLGVKWHRPSWPYIDPQKDAAADLLRQRNCLASPRKIQAERGREWSDVFTETVDDNFDAISYARKRALEMNGQFKDETPVEWRELLSLPTPDGVTVKLTGEDNSAGSPAPATNQGGGK